MFEKLQRKLSKRKEENCFRELQLNGDLVDFCSNDYLGLSKLLDIKNSDPVGSTGSRLLQGNYPLIEELEKDLAEFHKCSSALVYNSGYAANVGLFSALPQKGDIVLYDELIHASVKDGMRLSFATSYSFKHNDMKDFKLKLQKVKEGFDGEIFAAVESVYSMDGDQAPLLELADLSEQHEFTLVVDEAHAVGVFGDQGEGLVQALGLEDKVAVRVMTFGKALGCHGAAVLCPELIKEYLINFSRSFIYSTALPPASVTVIRHAYSFMKSTKQISILKEKIKYFKEGATARGVIGLMSSGSAIQCIVKSGNTYAKECSQLLQDQGFDVRPILSPTVLVGKERLRICIHAFNSELEIDQLLDNLSRFNVIKN